MYLNQFSVRIQGGREKENGYVEITHGTQYSLVMRNNRDVRCDAEVRIDGKHVGTWRINSNHSITIERPVHDTGRFTFYLAGSTEGEQAGLAQGDPNLGLVSVTFTPEKKLRPLVPAAAVEDSSSWRASGGYMATMDAGAERSIGHAATKGPVTRGGSAQSLRRAGGTGLSGQSGQNFSTAAALNYDYAHQVTINLRLVDTSQDTPRPLTATSSPIPPPVG